MQYMGNNVAEEYSVEEKRGHFDACILLSEPFWDAEKFLADFSADWGTENTLSLEVTDGIAKICTIG